MLGTLLDLLFPKKCVSCGKIGMYVCEDCQRKIISLDWAICPMCERAAIDGVTHPGCQTRYSLDGLVSFFRYDGPVKAAIKRLKYKPYLSELADILSQHVTLQLRSGQARNTVKEFTVIPVPLHPQRERERGFNQAALIGKAIAHQLSLPFQDNMMKRTRNTKPQVELKGIERRKNLVDAFALAPNPPAGGSQYPNILLVDDVWTTGSTLRTCANVLKRAGAKKIWAMTIAR